MKRVYGLSDWMIIPDIIHNLLSSKKNWPARNIGQKIKLTNNIIIMAGLIKKLLYLIILVILTHITAFHVDAGSVFSDYEKVILINQVKQFGIAYENGKKVFQFPVITGDDEFTTDPGIYVVEVKDENYYSRKYDTPMPYAIFFDFKRRKAIHAGEVPPPALKKDLATHGCIHVEHPYIERLYDWADEENTVVIIYGWRSDD